MTRINKYLAQCGLGSRRKVENIITMGRVRVNGSVVTSLCSQIDPEGDEVRVDGARIHPARRQYYIMLNKPRGYITSREDSRGRPIVMDLLPERFRRVGVFPVGRLDKDTEGLLLLTNDGSLAFRLTHPRFEIVKQYIVELDRRLSEEDRQKLGNGVFLYGRRTATALIHLLPEPGNTLTMSITEGRKRQIRLSFRHLGYRVRRLKRVGLGPIRLGKMASGSFRELKNREIKTLKKAISADDGR